MSSHRKNCRRYDVPGHAHSLTFSCFQRRPFLARQRTRAWMIQAIEQSRAKHGFHLWAYVLMPEHVHLLVWPARDRYSISQFLTTLKQPVSKRALLFVRSNAPGFLRQMEDRQPNGTLHHRFWQRGGGYDRNLTEPETIWAEIEYLHANPVRRGLCEHATDWPWSSASEYALPGSGPLSLDLSSFPRTTLG